MGGGGGIGWRFTVLSDAKFSTCCMTLPRELLQQLQLLITDGGKQSPSAFMGDGLGGNTARPCMQTPGLISLARCRIQGVQSILSALEACGIDNARIEIEGGCELPIIDGSPLGWCINIHKSLARPAFRPDQLTEACPRQVLNLKQPITVQVLFSSPPPPPPKNFPQLDALQSLFLLHPGAVSKSKFRVLAPR